MAHLLGVNNRNLSNNQRALGAADAQPMTKHSAQPETRPVISATSLDTLQLCVGLLKKSGMSRQVQTLMKEMPSWVLSRMRAVGQTELTLQGKPAQLYIDTGAEVTVISERTWKGVGQPSLERPDRTLRGPESTAIATLGKFTGIFGLGGRQAEGDVYVAKGLTRSLLGQQMISNLQLIRRIASIEPTSELSPKKEFPSLFKGLGKLEGEYTIELRDDSEPFSLSTPRRVAIPLLNCIRQELQRMEELGVIAKVNQPTEWCSSMVVVPKDNSKVRICVDLTRLNESVRRE